MLTRILSVFLILHPFIVIAFCFEEAALEQGISTDLLRSIARIESNNNPSAVNRNRNGSIDLGIMQINSSWIKPMGLDSQELLRNPCYNVKVAARILRKCMDRHGYTWEAIGCYNAVSPHSRVSYSWKIHDELKRGNHLKSIQSSSAAGESSLHFAVRDIRQEGE